MKPEANKKKRPTPVGSGDLLGRILRWLIRRDITKALAAIERITDGTRRLDEQSAKLLDDAYHRLYIARERMRPNEKS